MRISDWSSDVCSSDLVRMHQFSPFTDLLGQEGPRSKLLSRSMEIIGEAGSGVVVILNRHTPDAFTRMFRMKAGMEEPNMDELREYGVGAKILAAMGVHEMILLTNRHHSTEARRGGKVCVRTCRTGWSR